MDNKPRKELTTRDIVQIVRKEIIANRNETTALRAEIAVMRTELSGMHKVMEEEKLYIQSMALSIKAIREQTIRAGDGLEEFFRDMKRLAREALPEIYRFTGGETHPGPPNTIPLNQNIDSEFDEPTITPNPEQTDDNESIDEVTPIESNFHKRERCTAWHDLNGVEKHCILEKGHAGDHLFKCSSPNCPGYAWAHSSNTPHPANTCAGGRESKHNDKE